MCQIIVINKGEKEISTPRQFREHFGFEPAKDDHYEYVDEESCLCQCDVKATLENFNIPFKTYCGDYYVGLLDQVIGDEDISSIKNEITR
jgi:hypothetical protein